MSAPELVSVTVDGRTVQVAKGTGLVETAAAAGIEIPVFCYEPRLGPPVGACRMCLVEIEGMPKLQAGCSVVAADGMVVHTAVSSQKAAEGQHATLEFILVNHPLDCPVCDKGGECPLQDLTFRYGPGNTRMTFAKLTFDKPVPISPTIALDRERCILCYRCTRFSSDVAEDGQLIARNRGALSLIDTFRDEPYRAPFSGNVIELCPVGALTSTQYRFEARPWEIDDVPSVCGLCPAGCNVNVTTREGKVKRVLSRNHPELDRGWLCDRGRFSYGHLYAEDRIRAPLLRRQRQGLQETDWETALGELERLLRGAQGSVLLALSGSETNELAYGLARLARVGGGSNGVVLPEQPGSALDPYRVPLAAIGEAEVVVVVGDDEVAERAPAVELWLKLARRSGARVRRIGPLGDVPREPGEAGLVCRELADPASEIGKELRGAERAVLIWSGAGAAGGQHLAALAHALGLHEKPGSGALLLPATANGRGVSEAWTAAASAGGTAPPQGEEIGLLIVSGDEAAADPGVRELAERARATVVTALFPGLAAGWADLVLPGTSYLEREGTMLNLEGRLQRLRATVAAPVPDELEWLSGLAARFGIALPGAAPLLFEELSAALGGVTLSSVGEQAALAPRPEATPVEAPEADKPARPRGGPLQLLRYRPLFSGSVVERIPELAFQRPRPQVDISPEDAERRSIKNGDAVVVSSNGTKVSLQARIDRRLPPRVARVAEEHAGDLAGGVEVSKP
ncbi:MAG: 2Fe-2S iron-sulfur cluster-binding protein [Gaiellaceae bacterium]